MPTFDYWSMMQDAIARALQRQFGVKPLEGKRPRRAVAYADELLAKAQVNYGKINRRR